MANLDEKARAALVDVGIGLYLDREFPIKVHKLVNLTSVLDLKRAPCVGNLPVGLVWAQSSREVGTIHRPESTNF